VELGVFLLAGQFPGMTQAHALGGAVDYALAAERAGLTSAWVAEHHFISYGVCPSALALAANLLGRSHRLEVGTAVCMLANRHPVALAEETALLDHLSGGRFHLGVGRGGPGSTWRCSAPALTATSTAWPSRWTCCWPAEILTSIRLVTALRALHLVRSPLRLPNSTQDQLRHGRGGHLERRA